MAQVTRFKNQASLAQAVALQTVAVLNNAIESRGSATWVLAGGTTPNLTYAEIAEHYLDEVDWSLVTFLIGDERIGDMDSDDNNWHGIEKVFLSKIPNARFLRPTSNQDVALAAGDYAKLLDSLPKNDGVPIFDLLWLGMGEDGHTLSLFPNNAALKDMTHLVVPVFNSPKPPSDRISIGLYALKNVKACFILVSGKSKSDILERALQKESILPISQVAKTIVSRGGSVDWLIDAPAANQIRIH